MKKKNSVEFGAVTLILGGFVCKGLGAAFRLPLTNLLGLEGIGVFSLVMALFSFALVFTSGGVTAALSKLISASYARGEAGKVKIFVRHAIAVTAALSLAIGLAIAGLGGTISSLQGGGGAISYLLFPLLLTFGGLLAVFRGAFQGRRNMTPTALSQVLEQIFKFALGLLFAWIFSSNGTEMGVFGAFLGMCLSEAIALVFLALLFHFQFKNEERIREVRVVRLARHEFNSTNSMLMLSALVFPLAGALDSLFIVKRLAIAGFSEAEATALFGLQTGVVGTLLNLPLVISLSLSTSLLPNLTFDICQGSQARQTIERALRALLFLLLPTTFGLVAVFEPLFSLIYPSLSTDLLPTAFSLMFFGGFGTILTALMQFFAMLIQAHGQFRHLVISSVFAGSLKVFLTFFLSAFPAVNIFALVIGNILASGTLALLLVVKLQKISAFSLPFFDFFTLSLATLAMFFAVRAFLSFNLLPNFLNLVFAVAIGGFVYLLLSLPVLFKFKKTKTEEKIAG